MENTEVLDENFATVYFLAKSPKQIRNKAKICNNYESKANYSFVESKDEKRYFASIN